MMMLVKCRYLRLCYNNIRSNRIANNYNSYNLNNRISFSSFGFSKQYENINQRRSFCNESTTPNYISNQEFQIKESEVRRIISLLVGGKHYQDKKQRLVLIENELKSNGVESQLSIDNKKAQTLKECQRLKRDIEQIEELQSNFMYYEEISGEAKKKNDQSMLSEMSECISDLYQQSTDLEFKSIMSGENDHEDCYLEIHAGAGGADSMDWSEILSNMYRKWSQRKDFKVTLVDISPGEVGYKRAILKIEGEFAYGWCRSESGVHKLIRLSPFDSSGKRHTSFASVLAYPAVDDSISIDLQTKDLLIETMRSSGPGGQHSNKTESAVRITHTPTGISVAVSDQRSQHQNKSIAMDLLKAKIMASEIKKRAQQEESFRSDLGVNGWASDRIVRTYTMHPQTRVKDQRTNLESLNIDEILEGGDELDIFIKTALSQK
ncbi:class I peptide chain release factor [Heterostelium album PN500]|uniref:Class I peptide chain release factor n=1 Tax=Heterostelium pallidum (strain ATCC 26659 / Pp 5 / PN500) TaxID=670386 RepID=D3BH30_HETP5|nr:class I peptide chain release factor [Heterostelium album PN500]EFA79414.1 class I peptide chain release factor [Heterostelium album PN500]|eukprot:XP_020431535.1 class I peptide chain release factor [Heterostelium album PN500]